MATFTIRGKNVEVTPALRDYVEKRVGKVTRYFNDVGDIAVLLSVSKERQKVEVTVPVQGVLLRGQEVTSNMYTSIDRAIDLIERQIRKNKTRLEKKLRGGAFDAPSASAPETEEQEIRIVKSKKHALKPMSPEEAVLQMNLLGHEFFVFHNDETDKIDIVYKRKDGNYGLIEAEA